MRASSVLKGLLLLSGWGVAAWLFLSQPLPPIAVFPAPPGETPPPPTLADPAVDALFREWSADPALAGASIGFCLLDESGTVAYASPLAGHALCPASALKTVTTATALEQLGPDFHFTTTLSADAAISAAGVIAGDLRLTGSGDPTFSTADLHALAGQLLQAGLKQVDGILRLDPAAFREPPVSDHWNWGDIGNAYGAGAHGINLDHNRFSLRFQPAAAEGGPAALLDSDVATRDTRWVNDVLTGPPGSGDQVVIYSQPHGRTIRLHGTVPLGESGFAVSGALPDPPARAAQLLRDQLQAAGVKILGRPMPGDRPQTHVLATHRSRPLPAIIDHLHRVSDNLEAQSLFLTLGHRAGGDAAAAVRRHWESRGVAFAGLRLIDGSGLARANMIRPLDLAEVNRLARRGPHGGRFRESLTGYLGGRVRAKLGSMSGVKTDVGFITRADGREFTFALMANGLDPALHYWPLRDRLLQAVADR